MTKKAKSQIKDCTFKPQILQVSKAGNNQDVNIDITNKVKGMERHLMLRDMK